MDAMKTSASPTAPAAPLPSKPHYLTLDALRGVAAVMVLIFHIMETHMALAGGTSRDTLLNHTYLAVDFFFLLSGFVLAYAYDDRREALPFRAFARRRLIRLQPMVVLGGLLGAAVFYAHGAEAVGWGAIPETPVWRWAAVAALGLLLLPVPKALDIRGWGEMFPLNAVSWSLFYEYVGNVAYALVLRWLPTRWLAAFVGAVGAGAAAWLNGLYELAGVLLLFPAIVWLGAGATRPGEAPLCRWLGDLSYPLYITHFPFVLTYTAIVANAGWRSLAQAWPLTLLTITLAIAFAWASARLYDAPLHRWLSRR